MRLIGTHRIAAAWMPHFKSGEGNLIAFKRTIYACFGIAAKHPMETIGHLLPFIAAQGLLANSYSQPRYPEATFFKSLNHAGGRAFPGNTEVSRTWGRPTCSQFAVVWMHFESFPPRGLLQFWTQCIPIHLRQHRWPSANAGLLHIHVQTYDLNTQYYSITESKVL